MSPATLSKNVPILACGGISKKYMVPGWRLGWILIHDRNGAFKDEVILQMIYLFTSIAGSLSMILVACSAYFSPLFLLFLHMRLQIYQIYMYISLPLSLFPLQVTPGLARLAMKLLGPCTFNQAALPYIFENVPESYHQRSMDIFERNAILCCEMLKDVPGISPVMPAGAMYMMVSV